MPALAAALALQVLTVGMFAAGVGALSAALLSLPLTSRAGVPWVASIPRSAAVIGIVFVGASIGWFLLIPSRTALTRRLPPRAERIPTPVSLIAIGSCVAAVWQVPTLLVWWSDNRAAVDALVGSEAGSIGLKLVPAAVAYALPALAAAALLAFVLASALVLTAPAHLAFSILGSCAFVQAALVVAQHLGRRDMHAIGTGLISLLHSHDVATARASAWLTGNDLTAAAFESRMYWLLGASFAALACAELFAPVRAPARAGTPPAERIPEPQTVSPRGPAPSLLGCPFDQSNYSVRARGALWNPFVRRHSEYDIRTIPPMSSAQFSFSWKTGMLRREPDGAVLLAVAPPAAPGLFSNRSYQVTDAAGAPLGELVPKADDWQIVAASGQPAAYVLRGRAGHGFVRYAATLEDRELCRFTWTIAATVASAELEIEFTRDADPALRSLAVALAPMLELRARLFSERRTHN